MCYHNYTQHSGCGHYGEVYIDRYTPCNTVLAELNAKRGPSCPPLNAPQNFQFPKRSNTTFGKHKRFFSVGNVLQRSNTAASNSSRRTASGTESGVSRTSTSSFDSLPKGTTNSYGVADHELAAAVETCLDLKNYTVVTSAPGQVCQECKKWIERLSQMLKGYYEGRGVKGNLAFEEFLKNRAEPREIAHMLRFPPVEQPRMVERSEGDQLRHWRDIGQQGDDLYSMPR